MSDQLNIDSVLLCCRHGVSLYNVKTIIEHADLPHHVKSALREVSIRRGEGGTTAQFVMNICDDCMGMKSNDDFVSVAVIRNFWTQ